MAAGTTVSYLIDRALHDRCIFLHPQAHARRVPRPFIYHPGRRSVIQHRLLYVILRQKY
jgi:hypothetical protein